jgi:hypothetical protein
VPDSIIPVSASVPDTSTLTSLTSLTHGDALRLTCRAFQCVSVHFMCPVHASLFASRFASHALR